MPPFSQHYDYRSLFASPLAPRSHPSVGGWIRPKEPRSYDAPLLAALTDAWFPATFAHDPRFVMGATLDLTIHFRDYAAADRLSREEFLLAVFTSRLATEGFFEEDGELWTSDGRLIVQSRQLALGTPLGG
jgi:acyl-CoA thioesterase